jgi:hypothetical protein
MATPCPFPWVEYTIVVEDPLLLHPGCQALGQAAALAEPPRVGVDLAASAEEALGLRQAECVPAEEG